MSTPTILAFVGARGGSKGVKNKNIRLLAGKPLIQHTLDQIRAWGKAKRLIVSTDSQEIADVVRKCGVEVPFLRPAEMATDTASKATAIQHAFHECEKLYKEKYDMVMDLDVTAPIRSLKDIDDCLALFLKHKPKTIFSVVHAHKNPYFNMVEENKEGKAELCKKLGKSVYRRQDAPAVYNMNASIYFYRRDYVLGGGLMPPVSDDSLIYVMDDVAGIDIDREIDFQFIEFLLKEGVVKL